MIERMFGGGYCEPSEIRKGGKALKHLSPRLPKGGQRRKGVIPRG